MITALSPGAARADGAYDRPGNSRSPLHQAPARITMAEQSADAVDLRHDLFGRL